MPPDPSLADRLARHGQDQILRSWDRLDPEGRDRLSAEARSIDLDLIDRLVRDLVRAGSAPPIGLDAVGPVEVRRLPSTDGERSIRRQASEVGEAMIAAGEVGVILVAGGQGTRLGFDGPKGTYPIGPVTGASLFQVHAEKIAALGRRHGATIPLYVMTSPENHAATERFFADHGRFGLDHVQFFAQGQLPAVDRETGKILLSEPGRVALSPDGHGGTLKALSTPGPGGSASPLDDMRERGIATLFYFQVDNPMVRIADPAFLGLHRQAGAEVSFKVVEKVHPDEKVGVVVESAGRPMVIEYSDLPRDLAERRAPDGRLLLSAGSIAIHLFERSFIERIGSAGLPYHRADKKVAFVDDSGARVSPSSPNAVKFETFIFDALPMADRYAVVECDRVVEFEPLKNASGPDSPASVRRAMTEQFAAWLEAAGVTVERDDDGEIPFGIEISPFFAMEAADLRGKVVEGMRVDRALDLR